MNIYFFSFLVFLFLPGNLWAQFSEKEADYIACSYGRLISYNTLSIDLKTYYSIPDERSCRKSVAEFAGLVEDTLGAKAKKTRFPTYEDVWREFSKKTTTAQQRLGFLTSIHVPSGRQELADLHSDFKSVEQALRNGLKVAQGGTYSGSTPVGACDPSTKYSDISDRLSLYSSSHWRSALHSLGYDCTARIFRERYQRRNAELGLGQAQDLFRKGLEGEGQKVKEGLEGFLKGRAIVLIPQLGYDLPRGPFAGDTERLKFQEMEHYFQGLGARFYVVKRNTLSHLTEQVRSTKREIKTILVQEASTQKTSSPKILYLTRSMGSLVLRIVLDEEKKVRDSVLGVLNMGGTPWGSTIAEYKSRMDHFDENFVLITNPLAAIGGALGGILSPGLRSLMEAAKYRENIGSMSYRRFEPRANKQAIATMNVILLPPSLKQYFNGSSKIPPVDETFLQMAMYGPTEGSAPLWGASSDTARSATVVFERLNHLAFWELDPEEALQLWGSAVLAGFEQRLFR